MRETIGADIKDPTGVFAFWRAAGSGKWFDTDDAFDSEIRTRFLGTYEAAASGALNSWEATPEGALALVLLLDQFPRNMFRDTPRAFAADPLARAVADRAIARASVTETSRMRGVGDCGMDSPRAVISSRTKRMASSAIASASASSLP